MPSSTSPTSPTSSARRRAASTRSIRPRRGWAQVLRSRTRSWATRWAYRKSWLKEAGASVPEERGRARKVFAGLKKKGTPYGRPSSHLRRRARVHLPACCGLWRRVDDKTGKNVVLSARARWRSVNFMQRLEGVLRRGRAGVGRHQQQPCLPRGELSATLNGASIYIVAKRRRKIKDDKGEPIFQDIDHAPARPARRRLPALPETLARHHESSKNRSSPRVPALAAQPENYGSGSRRRRAIPSAAPRSGERSHWASSTTAQVCSGRPRAALASSATRAPPPRRPRRPSQVHHHTMYARPCRAWRRGRVNGADGELKRSTSNAQPSRRAQCRSRKSSSPRARGGPVSPVVPSPHPPQSRPSCPPRAPAYAQARICTCCAERLRARLRRRAEAAGAEASKALGRR